MELNNPPEDPAMLAQIEARLGTDYSAVAVHAPAANQATGAAAYATGPGPIFFTNGQYDPEATMEGRRLLAHELTHVVQQGGSGR